MQQALQKLLLFLSPPDLFPKDSNLAVRFEAERQRILNQAVQVGALLAAVLVPTFGILDYLFKTPFFETFLVMRGAVLMVSIGVLFASQTRFGRRKPYALGAFLTMLVSGSISWMCVHDLGPADPYYAGINLPILGFGFLLPTTFVEGVCVVSASWLLYFIPNALAIEAVQWPVFISNNFFMVSTILIALVSSRFHLHYRMREWYAHFKLEKAHRKIRNHSLELEKKVEERTRKLLQSERLAVVGQLAGGIAHDFNNHLTAIMGISGLILEDKLLAKHLRKDLRTVLGAAERATELVKQLLAFSRRQIMNPKVLNLNDVVQDVRRLLPRLIGENIELAVKVEPELYAVKVDPVQAEQILLNLAINSRDAMPSGGKILVETANVRLERPYLKARHLSVPPGNYVMLVVSDNGIGMHEEVKAKIFEPFFTTKENGRGTGLGLSTVYGIVKQSHGDIIVYSEAGVGTMVKILLPGIAEKSGATDAKRQTTRLAKGKETILLVEDEAAVRNLTARFLKQQGYKVILASEGQEALSKAGRLRGAIHLLLTDVVMPNMNGKELAERLLKEYGDIKVLYFSGYTDSFILEKGMILPENPFLQKPFTIEALSNKVRQVIDN